MKRETFYKMSAALFILALFGGCKDTSNFTVKGVVAGASGQILYLENTGVSSIIALDSLKLTPNGAFKFKKKRTEYPDFYRLRLNKQLIHFSIDSTETVEFTADAHNFATSYTVEGSEDCKAMKEITLAQLDANHAIHKLRESYGLNMIPDSTYQKSVNEAVKTYKETAKRYVFGKPKSTAAYFALFQQIDGLWLFDLYDRDDSKAYRAVATSYKHYYPESQRAKQLESLALQSLKVIRGERRPKLDIGDVQEVNYIDIDLPDLNGKNVKLSHIARNKAMLVNFTVYQSEWSPAFNMQLHDLYAKYNKDGLEIYQVSLDGDEHFWKNIAVKIPWTCVRDPQSIYSSIAAIYNVRQIPMLLLLNKKGELIKRIENMETLENDIKKVL